MKRKNWGTILIIIGGLFIGAALTLIIKNLLEQENAQKMSQEALESLMETIPENVEEENPNPVVTATPTLAPEDLEWVEYPDYILNPDMDMPETKIDDIPYIGYLEFTTLDLKLPIISETTYPYLKKAPCRYEGSAYLDNLVIGAHNYTRHFGEIGNLSYGDQIVFTDMDGNQFYYEVATIEILQPTQLEDLCSGEWPLTLYTCTLGGKTRVVVRCEKIKEVPYIWTPESES